MYLGNRYYWVLLFLFSIMLYTPIVNGKCPHEVYVIKGSIVSEVNNKDSCNTFWVSIFFDDLENGQSFKSSLNCDFQLYCPFNTYKWRPVIADICGKKPTNITVVISADGFYPKKVKFKFKDVIDISKDNSINLPEIKLIKLNDLTEKMKNEAKKDSK